MIAYLCVLLHVGEEKRSRLPFPDNPFGWSHGAHVPSEGDSDLILAQLKLL